MGERGGGMGDVDVALRASYVCALEVSRRFDEKR
jgi:hypothetical protein